MCDETEENQYFEDDFIKTKRFYEDVKEHLIKSLHELTTRSQSPSLNPPTPIAQPGPSGHSIAPSEAFPKKVSPLPRFVFHDVDKPNQIDEMMRKQQSNFKAFARTISQINLNVLTEKWEFQDILKTIELRWAAIDSLHWEIDSNLEQVDSKYEELFNSYENEYSEIKKCINNRMWEANHRDSSTPKIDIPIFNGNYQQWISFKDLFLESIHKNKSMSQAQKMQFLKSKLRGEAEKLIQHLHISSENYQTCWDILNQRYNNKKLIFNSHMNTIMSLPVMHQQTASNIKKLHDTTNECLNAIKNLGVDISTWDPMIVYLITQKLDAETYNEYINSLPDPRDLPYLQDFLSYLEGKFIALETARRKIETPKYTQPSHNQQQHHYNQTFPNSYQFRKPRDANLRPFNMTNRPTNTYVPRYVENKPFINHSTTKTYQETNQKCLICPEYHALFLCNKFREFNDQERRSFITKHNICKNCLISHNGQECMSQKTCRFCQEKHNTLLHYAYRVITSTVPKQPSYQSKCVSHVSKDHQSMTDILLATAQVNVLAADGTYKTMRALIDQGSQTSIISEDAAQQLGIPRQRCKGSIFGIGEKESSCKGVMTITISSLHNDFTIKIDAFIMKNLIKKLPNHSFTKPSWPYLERIQLADPEFNQSRPIDLLLGADVYPEIMLHGIIKEDQSQPIAQQTQFGWILCGNVKSYYCNVILNNYDDIQKFWEIEDLKDGPDTQSSEDFYCLNQYQNETKRQPDGRYVVRLPMKPDVNEKLGESKSKAIAQFHQLENKFRKNNQIAIDYKQFMNEYLNLGHMKISPNNHALECFLPHHCVIRTESTTSAIRVVFNGSAKTSTGHSVNDLMYSGPNLQHDLLSIIIKWRQYKIGYVADAEKMYRQILVCEEDQKYQKIIWRDSPNKPLREYQLTTVTYGTKAAPFLALMTMKQLAKDEAHRYPEAAKALENNLYMDDLLHGQHNIEDAKKLKDQLIELFKAGGFNLRKWKSNEPKLIENHSIDKENSFEFKQQESTKTLGLKWVPLNDQFSFDIKILPSPNLQLTKRELLSEISKVFDPLGWLSPVTIKLKLLFQSIWQLDLKWDDILPENITNEWNQSKIDLQLIKNTQIPRWLKCNEKDTIELHGFCDASTKAYACVIFCKTHDSVVIVAAKSRLVPVKKDVTLPRLELCAAQLMTKLMKMVKSCLSEHHITTFGWSDSTAVLGWINGDPSRWKPFVANRVHQITEIIPPDNWNYVKSAENPADCASRGITAAQLIKQQIWWNGPTWLPTFKKESLAKKPKYTTQEETKKQYQTNVITKPYENDVIGNLISKNSNYLRMCRVLAWVKRAFSRDQNKPSYLTIEELKRANDLLVRHVQQTDFCEEECNLKNHIKLNSKSRLLPLQPYLDSEGILRVGGRIKHANLSEEMKHPIILPNNNHLTDTIIDYYHNMCFHGGPRLTLAWLRRKFWIIGGNRAIKKRLRRCVRCRRAKFETQNQLMGDLPAARTNQTRPFLHTGVDFTGFVEVKSNKGRGIKCSKGYIAVFVCLATKAVHLELVSDLTSSSFIAALRRMSARRGAPRHMYSDNGTNFVGANNTIQQEYFNLKQTMNENVYQNLADMQIEWHFNAPSWPSAGGLWESAVKSLKYHLRRVLGDQKLTYEEFTTLLAQIEGCLNTRPLCAISEDPDDLDFLTPSHFLASGPLCTIIETEKDERTRWRLVQKIYHDVWKRWQAEYLTHLNTRSKWRQPQNNVKVNDIVIIQDVHVSPGKWALGRVLEIHPGSDGLVRVVTIKTKGGLLKRPITKISVLPINQEQNQPSLPTPTTKANQKNSDQPSTRINHDKPNNLSPRTTAKKPYICNLLTMTLMLFALLISPSHCSYNTTKLRNNQTIYFDKISNMRLITDEWKLVVFYDMDAYWEGVSLAKKYLDHLENLCQKIQIMSHCQLVLLHLHHCESELEHYNEILTNHGQLSENHQRRRRGLVNAIGSIAHSLFGVLDDDFAQQYQRDLNKLRSNHKYFNQLLKNQTSIIESEYNVIKRIEKTVRQQHKTFNQHLNKLENLTNTMQKQIQENTYANEFALSSITANGILMNLKDIQQMLLNTITDIFHGKFNIHLLKPEQLTKELHIISGQISKELSLPIDNIQTDLTKIYHLLTVKTRFTEKYLIFEIKIPLVTRDTFEMYKLIPIPIEISGKMQKIIIVSDLLAINIQKDLQIPFSELQYQQCIHYDSDNLLCAHQIPISITKTDQSYCIKEKESFSCKTESIKCKNTWVQLHKVNNYLYSCCGQCSIQIICDYQITIERLDKVGILALASGCVIKDDGITLLSHKESITDIKLKPDILHIEIPTINNIVNVTMPLPTYENDTDQIDIQWELKAIGEKIDQVKNNTKEDVEEDTALNYHDVHHYIAIYILASAGIIACLGYCVRRIRARVQWRATAGTSAPPQAPPAPQPQPRVRATTPHPCHSEHNQCFSVSDQFNQLNNHSSASASERVYARVNKVKVPNSFSFSVVE
ncbi:hypothetical protein ABMA27_015693 [Loxostege sticticalis]|uniref:Integrase catalytic domain-containing protein n=1 Tax=Loxostege sticticalis TaxID=481309 RepID=A0ABR3I3Y3_LOXSC